MYGTHAQGNEAHRLICIKESRTFLKRYFNNWLNQNIYIQGNGVPVSIQTYAMIMVQHLSLWQRIFAEAAVFMVKNVCLGCSVYGKELLLRLQCLWSRIWLKTNCVGARHSSFVSPLPHIYHLRNPTQERNKKLSSGGLVLLITQECTKHCWIL